MKSCSYIMHTYEFALWKYEGQDWSDAFISQGMNKIAKQTLKTKEKKLIRQCIIAVVNIYCYIFVDLGLAFTNSHIMNS